VPKLSINFEEILSRAHENFEEQNKVYSTIIIINYCITIINVCNNYTINYYFSNKDPQEYDKGENMAVTGAATASCLKIKL